MERWYIEFPTYRYVEDVKELAKKHSLQIVDKRFQGKEKQCQKPPKLTLKEEYRPKKVIKTKVIETKERQAS